MKSYIVSFSEGNSLIQEQICKALCIELSAIDIGERNPLLLRFDSPKESEEFFSKKIREILNGISPECSFTLCVASPNQNIFNRN